MLHSPPGAAVAAAALSALSALAAALAALAALAARVAPPTATPALAAATLALAAVFTISAASAGALRQLQQLRCRMHLAWPYLSCWSAGNPDNRRSCAGRICRSGIRLREHQYWVREHPALILRALGGAVCAQYFLILRVWIGACNL